MPWDGSDRRQRLPADWPARRRRVLERDGYRCTALELGARCPRRATDVDHVRAGDDHRDENLCSLCGDHHARKSSSEGVAARRRQLALRRRTPERHPGLIPPE